MAKSVFHCTAGACGCQGEILQDIFELSCLFEKLAGKGRSYDDYEEEKNYDRAFKAKKEKKENLTASKLHNIANFEELLVEVKKHLQPITDINITGAGGWVGSSRMVFKWGEDKVLKVAYNPAGLAQNFFEGRLSNQNDLFTKVFDMHKRGWWLVAEKITPLKSEDDFYHEAGFPAQLLDMFGRESLSSNDFYEIEKWSAEEGYPFLNNGFSLFKEIYGLMKRFDLLIGDTSNPLHWGINDDGKLKLYDYGIDKYIFDNQLEYVNPEYFHEKKLQKAKEQDLIETRK